MKAKENRSVSCAYCKEKIQNRPTRQDDEYFCSVQCADKASGLGSEEPEEYFDESDLEGLYEEE